MDRRDVIHDSGVVLGLTVEQHKEIATFARRVQHIFVTADANPDVAFTALLNVMGSLIGTALTKDRDIYTKKVQVFLPLYVEAYRVKEKIL